MDMLTPLVRHMDWFLDHGVWDERSPVPGLWWSMLDLKTGKPPVGERAAGVAKRCYRYIESPNGSNLYWDGPLAVAAYALSARTADDRYSAAADRYIRAYINTAASPGGLLWWGNHYYIGSDGEPLWFPGSLPPEPVRGVQDDARLHETRPLPVPWTLLSRIDFAATCKALAAHRQHLAPEGGTGCFNRHADGKVGCAFQEAGGILALSLCHHASLADAPESVAVAREVVDFTWSTRNSRTGLMPVNPTKTRWDKYVATSEVGLWAGTLFAAGELAKEQAFVDKAADAIGAWSDHAWCPKSEKYVGRVNIETAEAETNGKTTIYCPGTFSDPWEPLFPAHDYPFQAAEASITAWQLTQDKTHALAVERWIKHIGQSLPARNGMGAYAEHYGRAVHLFWRAGDVFSRTDWKQLAETAAAEAFNMLQCDQCLRTHPWEDRTEAVDGLGWLMLAILCLETGEHQPMYGLLW